MVIVFICVPNYLYFSNCNDLGKSYVKLIDSKARGYGQAGVISDNYTKESSLKEERHRRKSKRIRSCIVEESTCIKDKGTFLASNDTKDSLTLYLAQRFIDRSTTENLVTVIRNDVMIVMSVQVYAHVKRQTLSWCYMPLKWQKQDSSSTCTMYISLTTKLSNVMNIIAQYVVVFEIS